MAMYKKIMVPLDGSQIAECVIPHIETIAKKSAAKVELVTVIEPLELPTRGQIAISDDEIEQVSQRLSKAGIKTDTVILSGKPADRLVLYAVNNGIDLIIMATHGRSGISRLFWGSVAEKILRATDIPVLLVKTTTCEADS
jgi:nucleotide-binding universal stress UspA family protein